MSPTVTLLLVATAFDEIYERRLVGILWLVLAAVLAIVATVQLRLAQGMKLQRVKSGQLYKRSFAMANKTDIKLDRVYVVPGGKAHLTNAYGMRRAIAITDNYGKFLDEAELDFVIAHELAHVKRRHARKEILTTAVCYLMAALACFLIRPIELRPAFDTAVALLPILLFYFLSRRFEYEADRAAFGWTASSEAGIQALVNLYRETETPVGPAGVSEWFMTHPALPARIQALQSAAKKSSKIEQASLST